MENLVNVDVNSVLNWLNAGANANPNANTNVNPNTNNNLNANNNQNISTWTKYTNKIENVSFKWNNLNITVTTRRSFWDYVRGFIFFVMRCMAVVAIILYWISVFGLNFADSFWDVRDKVTSKINSSFNLSWNMNSFLGKKNIVNDYIWLMDDLLNNK